MKVCDKIDWISFEIIEIEEKKKKQKQRNTLSIFFRQSFYRFRNNFLGRSQVTSHSFVR